jgi:hypothetical protein
MSRLVSPCLVLSFRVVSCLVLSGRFLSCPVLAFLIVSSRLLTLTLSCCTSHGKVDYDKVYKMLGLDAVMFLRMLSLGAKYFAVISVWGMVVLCPVYGTGASNLDDAESDDGVAEPDDIARISMSNLVRNDGKLYLSVVSAYLFAGILARLLWMEWHAYLELRQTYLSEPGPVQYTVIVRDIPTHLRSDEGLAKYFVDLFGSKVYKVMVNADLVSLDKIVQQREAACAELERCMLEQETQRREQEAYEADPYVAQRCFGTELCGGGGGRGAQVDAIPHLEHQLRNLNQEVQREVEIWRDIKKIHQRKRVVSGTHHLLEEPAAHRESRASSSSSHGRRPSGSDSFLWQEGSHPSPTECALPTGDMKGMLLPTTTTTTTTTTADLAAYSTNDTSTLRVSLFFPIAPPSIIPFPKNNEPLSLRSIALRSVAFRCAAFRCAAFRCVA